MVNKGKKFLIVMFFTAGIAVLKTNRVSAVIARSPHDILSWYNVDTSYAKAGICAYCHVPHTAKGDRLFPIANSTEAGKYGTVASLCGKCHQTQTYLSNTSPLVNNQIYAALDTTPAVSTVAVFDTHPVRGTGSASGRQSRTLQNTHLDTPIALDWPWSSSWTNGGNDAKGIQDIECTTCHNVHDWNPVAYNTSAAFGPAKRKFLRAPVYNEYAEGSLPKNFCAYCHLNREDPRSSNTTGTHPVQSGGDGTNSTTSATFNEYGIPGPGAGAASGLYLDTVLMLRPFTDSGSLWSTSASRANKALWDSAGYGGYLGGRIYQRGGINQIICQSCHMPHGVRRSNDDVYGPNPENGNDTVELRVGPLLAINNAANWQYANTAGFPLTSYPANSETMYVIPAGQGEENFLCEWCHGMTPELANARETTAAFSHPVNAYPASTKDNRPSDFSDYGTVWLKYPIRSWLKYRESGGIRLAYNPEKLGVGGAANPDLPPGPRPAGNYYLVCLSCHEAHQSLRNSPILKFGSETSSVAKPGDTTFCDGCHYDTAMGAVGGTDTTFFSDWVTHPSGVSATLRTSDAEDAGMTLKLPNRAGLRTFNTAVANSEYISCWTCHKAHKGIESPMLADYQWPFSQICVNCHTEGDTNTARVFAGSKDAKWAYGTTGADSTNANPSLYYVEGAAGAQNAAGRWWRDNTSNNPIRFSFGDTTRLGSHYIGQYTGGATYPRPTVTDTATRGWLGERNVTRGEGNVKMTELDHRPGTPLVSGEELRDKWLMQQMEDETYDTFMVFETMIWYGSGQKSHIGTTDVDVPNRRSIICQTCHAVHNTAIGVADNADISRLLLAPNLDSYMCKRCHIPEADTTVTHPMSVDTSGSEYNTANLFTGQQNFKYNTLVTRTGREVDLFSGNYAYAYASVIAPANYPDPEFGMSNPDTTGRRMNCDACHTVHNADSRMGAMILEGNNSTYVGGMQVPYWNKVPRIQEREDRKTCNLCHKQGK